MKNKLSALFPFIVFIGGFLGTGLVLSFIPGIENPFGVINPIIITILAIIISIGYIALRYKMPYSQQVNTYLEGMGRKNILVMCIMFILAGAFNEVCKSIGAIDSMVNLGMSIIPVKFLIVGCFAVASFMSLSIGTSMGTIISVAPIASGLAVASGISESLVVAAVIGGAMLGDNLSVISGTNIAAAESVGATAKDKFKVNSRFSIVAFIVTTIVYIIISSLMQTSNTTGIASNAYNIIHIIPYLVVIVGSSIGLDVFIVLLIGITSGAAIGLAQGSLTLMTLTETIYNGFTGMTEVFLLTMFMGGIAFFVEKNGGIDFILSKISRFTKNTKSTLFGLFGLGLTIDASTANNTVSVIAISSIGRTLGEKYNIDKALIATILSISTCIMQGIIPYGAQILLAKSLTQNNVSTISLALNNYYCWVLLVVTVCYIGFQKTRESKKMREAIA